MKFREFALQKAMSTPFGTRLTVDKRYRILTAAVIGLIGNLLFAFYNGILGFLSVSSLFLASAVYYLLLSGMRFAAIVFGRKENREKERWMTVAVGGMLITLSLAFQAVIIISIKDDTAAVYGTIPMIAIATFTFSKITAAIRTAVKHRKNRTRLYRAINAIRYSEVAVSLLAMQQSMLVSFEGADKKTQVILNACTGAGVCFFILALGILTLKRSRKVNL